ncbi:putative p15-2B protein [Ixodes scapularis]|uniref:NTF2-related export protein n=1 Tax=Ixodes scapularis TaxID=6945 RepID=B7Q0J3_IXOSC|nr:p15-2B protein, putative [Ixodes scapularis]|eukprot:XP_002407895.1 p15-2B protein, putative [Ixodes scapularis]
MAALAASTVDSQRQKDDQATKAGEEFAKLFYDTLEKRRHLLSNLFLDTANVLWNGNAYSGKADIGKFYEGLPTCETDLAACDSQPIRDDFVQGQTTIHVIAAGRIKFSGKRWTPFSESFLLTAQGTVWKIVVDTFRFQEPAPI